MENHYDYKRYSVLYVDDEPQALKYFAKAFAADFRVRTAASVADAWKIIDQDGDDIGVLITDQRMPAQTGTDLMEQVRARRPDMVRILTTAYSDLTSAIEAVNAGGAFQYVTKPWRLPELRGTLLRAMEHFLVRKDRDRLLADKLHVLQRMIVMDRVRGLAALSTALTYRLRNTSAALKSYVKQAPLEKSKSFAAEDAVRLDLWTLTRSEAEGLVRAVGEVMRETMPAERELHQGVNLENVVHDFVEDVKAEKAEDGVTLQFRAAAAVPAIKADPQMIRRLIEILTERISDMDGEDRVITIRVSPLGDRGVRLQLTADDSAWLNGQVASLYSAIISKPVWPMGIDMDTLASFFIAHHHGGDVTIHPKPPLGPGFEVTLAADPEAAEALESTQLDAEWFDLVFTRLETFDETTPV